MQATAAEQYTSMCLTMGDVVREICMVSLTYQPAYVHDNKHQTDNVGLITTLVVMRVNTSRKKSFSIALRRWPMIFKGQLGYQRMYGKFCRITIGLMRQLHIRCNLMELPLRLQGHTELIPARMDAHVLRQRTMRWCSQETPQVCGTSVP